MSAAAYQQDEAHQRSPLSTRQFSNRWPNHAKSAVREEKQFSYNGWRSEWNVFRPVAVSRRAARHNRQGGFLGGVQLGDDPLDGGVRLLDLCPAEVDQFLGTGYIGDEFIDINIFAIPKTLPDGLEFAHRLPVGHLVCLHRCCPFNSFG